MNSKGVIIVLLLVLSLGIVVYLLFSRGGISNLSNNQANISNFEECVAAGNPIMESDPPQCMANGVTYTAEKSASIVVNMPSVGGVVTSPMDISGEAMGGTWFFEGEFQVFVYADNGDELGIGFGTATDDWMIDDFVPFTGTVAFMEPSTPGGSVVFVQSDPSGMQVNLQEFIVPVRFE